MDPLSSILFSRQSSFSHENEFYIEGQIESLDAGSKTLLRSVVSQTQCLKITQNVTFVFSIIFCPLKTDLSGNTV